MKNRLLPVLFLVLNVFDTTAQETLQEKLGYTKETKLLIIHADDLGVSHSENEASITAMENGFVNSASIMVPCPWFSEIANYARTSPLADLGLHLTLTSEWKHFKWGPVYAKEKVPGLVNKKAFMFESADSVINHAEVAEVETELRAQIERAEQFGVDFTHLDSHMGVLFGKAEYLNILLKLGREYRVPVMLSKQVLGLAPEDLITPSDVVLDMIYMASPENYKNGMEHFYTGVLESVQPGVSIILLHAAFDDREMQAVTVEHPDYGADWRQADFDFFTSEKCGELLEDNDIRLITWREIRDKLLRSN